MDEISPKLREQVKMECVQYDCNARRREEWWRAVAKRQFQAEFLLQRIGRLACNSGCSRCGLTPVTAGWVAISGNGKLEVREIDASLCLSFLTPQTHLDRRV